MYLAPFLNYIEKQGFPDWENWGNDDFLCSKILDNTKIIGNFPDWENRGNDEKLLQ